MGDPTGETPTGLAEKIIERNRIITTPRALGVTYNKENADLPWNEQYKLQNEIFAENHQINLQYSDEFVESTQRFFLPNGSFNETATIGINELTNLTRVSLLAAREQSHPEYSGYNLLPFISAIGNRIAVLAPSLQTEEVLRKAQTEAVKTGIRQAYEQCPERNGIFNTIFTQLSEKYPETKFYTSSENEELTPIVDVLSHFRRLSVEAPPLPPSLAPPPGSK